MLAVESGVVGGQLGWKREWLAKEGGGVKKGFAETGTELSSLTDRTGVHLATPLMQDRSEVCKKADGY